MEEDRSDMIAQFCAITGAPAHIGENYLIAHDWALERAVDFYMDHPPQEGGVGGGPDPFDEPAGVPVAQPDVVEIPDDDDEGAGISELARQRASALAARQQAEQQMEDMMGSAQEMFSRAGIELPPEMLAVHGHALGGAAAAGGPSSRPRRGSGGRAPAAAPADLMDMDADDMDAIAAAVTGAAGAAALPADEYGSLHRRQQQQMLEHYQQLARQREAAAAAGPLPLVRQRRAAAAAAAGEDGFEGVDDEAAAAEAAADAADATAAAAAVTGVGVGDDEPLDLPEGINLEEARMLEAAMLGVPYQGRMPEFGNAAAAGPPLSPGAMEQRSLRAEQDAAYEDSLALDRAKQETIAAAQAAAEAQERAEYEAATAAAQAEADSARALAELLHGKRQRLDAVPEPAAGEAGSFTVVVRLPDGSRKGRRFRQSDQLQAVFDFVDIQCTGADAAAAASGSGGAAGSEGGCGGVKPGGYRLVTQFPRKVYVEGSAQRLADAGITSDSALFIEQL